jgi:hypothetical protein
MADGEKKLLEIWRLRFALATLLIVPTATAVGAYYQLDARSEARHSEVVQRVQELELQSSKSFAEKNDLKEIQQDIKQMHEDIVEIKSILRRGR